MGYVGLPLALRFAESGFRCIGFDVDQFKIEQLNLGNSYIRHLPSDRVGAALAGGKLSATSDFSRAAEVDALIICVPTPLDKHREPDISYITQTMDSVQPFLRKGQIVSLESTTYPGTTEEELRPRIESRGLKIGEDVFLLFSPEREDPGNRKFDTQTTPKIIGGATPACLAVGMALYGSVIDKMVPVSSTQTAEMAKLLENIYRAVNIGLVNELKTVADRMGIDIWEVIDAAATKPFGFVPFYPGPGLGGHCIPIDPFYLTWKAKEFGVSTRFIELAGEVNTSMPHWVFNKVTDALNQNGKPLKNSKILILGVAYKKNIDDIRESPALEMIEMFFKKQALVSFSDPYVSALPSISGVDVARIENLKISSNMLRNFDCVLILTNHDIFDYDLIQKHSQLIIDTRGCYRKSYANVVRA